jgi:hypothetical protein
VAHEHAGPCGLGGVEEHEDAEEEIVVELAEAVLAGVGGLRVLDGVLPSALVHGNGGGLEGFDSAWASIWILDCATGLGCRSDLGGDVFCGSRVKEGQNIHKVCTYLLSGCGFWVGLGSTRNFHGQHFFPPFWCWHMAFVHVLLF